MSKKLLCDLKIGENGRVKTILNNTPIKRRLLDIGLTKDTRVESVLQNYSNNLRAYMIRGALIAIRNEDAKCILVEVC